MKPGRRLTKKNFSKSNDKIIPKSSEKLKVLIDDNINIKKINPSTNPHKADKPSRPAPSVPKQKICPNRKPPDPPSLCKIKEGYSIQETSELDTVMLSEFKLQDFNFLPIYETKIKDCEHSLFIGDSPLFGIVVIAIIHPEKEDIPRQRKKTTQRNLSTDKLKKPTIQSQVETAKKKKEEVEEIGGGDAIPIDALIRGVPGDVFFTFTIPGIKSGFKPRQLIKGFQEFVKSYQDTNFKYIKDPQLVEDLCIFEKNLVQKHYKFGLMLREKDINDEDELYSINTTTPDFEEFCSWLGEKVTLKGWSKYNAGLDVKNDLDGPYSIYTSYKDLEIMWHVCPILTYSDSNSQQVQRKRHIGNDCCVVIFDESETPFDPSLLTSRFNHVQIVIRKHKDLSTTTKTFYELSVVSKRGVGDHYPLLPRSRIMEKNAILREFLYTKLINAERASYLSVAFSKAISRTREGLLRSLIWDKYSQKY